MKRTSTISKFITLLLCVLFLYSSNVREIHYLFTSHTEVREHCENHLHAADTHADCQLCKIDLSSCDEPPVQHFVSSVSFDFLNPVHSYDSPTYQRVFLSPLLRGPPSFC